MDWVRVRVSVGLVLGFVSWVGRVGDRVGVRIKSRNIHLTPRIKELGLGLGLGLGLE